MQRLKTFKYHEGNCEVNLTLVNDRGNEKVDVLTFKSNDRPKPELEKALQQMVKHLVEHSELPEEYKYDVTVRRVSLTRDKNGHRGVVVSGSRDLEGSKSPLNISSPLFYEEWDSEEEAGDNAELSVFSAECGEDIKRLEELVIAYYNGDRQQQVFQFAAPEAEEVEEEPEPDLVLST